jgi:peptidylprolyl isomerase
VTGADLGAQGPLRVGGYRGGVISSTRKLRPVLRRLRRPTAALGAVLLVPVLAACGGGGSDKASDTDSKAGSSSGASAGAGAGLSEVSFTGDVGKSLTATWHSTVDAPKSTTVTTLVKGSGDKIADGDTVSTYLWLGDGTTKKEAYSDYTQGSPESIPNNGQLGAVFGKLFEGSTYGSRVVAVTTPTELFGSASGTSQLGIGANDSLVVVADLVEKAAVSPTPTDDSAHDASPSSQPTVVEKDGKPSGLDWSGISEPALDTPVQRVVLKKGTGPAVKSSDTVTVNYLGETYQAKTPFDESYTKTPLTSPLSSLIQGWSIGLTGVNVGSRVLLQIPPAYGYGAEGGGSSIPGNATLWFVVDVVGVK